MTDHWYLYQDDEGDWGVRCDRDPVTGFPKEYAPTLDDSAETALRARAICDALNEIHQDYPLLPPRPAPEISEADDRRRRRPRRLKRPKPEGLA